MPEQTYAIRLPDGQRRDWTARAIAEFEGDWMVNLASVTPEEWKRGYPELLHALFSDEPFCWKCGAMTPDMCLCGEVEDD